MVKPTRRVWFSRGRMPGFALAGRASTEYGERTWWLRLPGGALVVAGRRYTYAEVVAEDGEHLAAVWRGRTG